MKDYGVVFLKMRIAVIFILSAVFILASCARDNADEKIDSQKTNSSVIQVVQNMDEEPSNFIYKNMRAPAREALPSSKSFMGQSNFNLPSDEVYYTGKVVVLTYHHISTKPLSSITISPDRFEADLKMLKESHFNIISFRDMINGMQGLVKFPPNAVVITFDDGYDSFYTYAYPLLQIYNVPAVCFVITSWTEGLCSLSKDFNSLNPYQIREMYESGLVDVQSHSHKGHDYIIRDSKGNSGGFLAFQIYDSRTGKTETSEDYKKRVFDDLSQSIPIIAKYTDNTPDTLCFPFGHFNSRLVGIAKEAGFKYFVTTMYGVNKQNSKSIYIYRIRSGDAKLNSGKLKQNIIECGREVQLVTP